MWCGPRNISTALMRAWENRPDTYVVDEPLYAHYLRETKLPHAMANEIIERYEDDWEKVVAWLTGNPRRQYDFLPKTHVPPHAAKHPARLAWPSDQLLSHPRTPRNADVVDEETPESHAD